MATHRRDGDRSLGRRSGPSFLPASDLVPVGISLETKALRRADLVSGPGSSSDDAFDGSRDSRAGCNPGQCPDQYMDGDHAGPWRGLVAELRVPADAISHRAFRGLTGLGNVDADFSAVGGR